MNIIRSILISAVISGTAGCSIPGNNPGITGQSYYCDTEGEAGGVCHLDYYLLLANPLDYDQKMVATLAYLIRVSDGYLLYPDESRARSMFMASALVLNDARVSSKLDALEGLSSSGVYVEVTGVFLADTHNPQSYRVFAGHMGNIDRITLLKERDDHSFTFYGDVLFIKSE